MEENQKKQKSNGKTLFTVALSLFVAIAAIVSLVGVGFNQVSYAAETPSETTTTDVAAQTFMLLQGKDSNPQWVVFGEVGIPTYYRLDNNEPSNEIGVFCVQKKIDAAVNDYYEKYGGVGLPSEVGASEEVEFGMLRLLDRKDSLTASIQNKYVKNAAVQAAIWLFLNEKLGSSGVHDLAYGGLDNDTVKANLTGFSDAYLRNSDGVTETPVAQSDVTAARTAINNLVAEARKGGNNDRTLSVTPTSKNLHQTQDKKFYLSDAIKVSETSGTETMTNYTVTARGIDGIKIVDKDNNEKSQFSVGSEFYIQVPADKVTDVKKTITVNVEGTFDGILTGRYYRNTGHQTVVTVERSTVVIPGSTTLEVVGTKDTAMSSVQTIYFIGLVVLLCGIGIIYANAKPVEEK